METEKLQEILGLCMEIKKERKNIVEFKVSSIGLACQVWIKEGGLHEKGIMKEFRFYDSDQLKEENETSYQRCVKYLQKLLEEK